MLSLSITEELDAFGGKSTSTGCLLLYLLCRERGGRTIFLQRYSEATAVALELQPSLWTIHVVGVIFSLHRKQTPVPWNLVMFFPGKLLGKESSPWSSLWWCTVVTRWTKEDPFFIHEWGYTICIIQDSVGPWPHWKSAWSLEKLWNRPLKLRVGGTSS